MMLPDATAASLRHAALELHRLREADRAWILGALTAQQRSTLVPLLAELAELGLAAGPSTLPAHGERPVPPATQAAPEDLLDDGSPLVISRLLAAEPPRLAAAVLAGRSPTWQSCLLGILEPGQAADARQAMAAVARASALQAAARLAVQQRVLAEGGDVRRNPSWLDRIRTRLGRGRTP